VFSNPQNNNMNSSEVSATLAKILFTFAKIWRKFGENLAKIWRKFGFGEGTFRETKLENGFPVFVVTNCVKTKCARSRAGLPDGIFSN
jgi:hypothetical protein